MIRYTNGILLILSLVIVLGCETKTEIYNHEDVVEYFNSKGRYPRFVNSDLLFGDTIGAEIKKILEFDPKDRVYRKAAYQLKNDQDAIIYFMYGLSRIEPMLSQVRIRSFKRDSLAGDFLIIDLDKDSSISYDYWFDEPMLIVEARNKLDETHYSYYRFYEGQIINTTFVPDTIFKKTDLMPRLGSIVQIYDEFNDKLLRIGDQEESTSGKIIKMFRGEDCREHMILALTDSLLGYKYLLVDYQFDATTSISGLQNDSLIEGREACLKISAKPPGEIQWLKEKAYIDYQ
ncbi:hypothetical protein [Lewinella cohaerens]|uniref:hypothetical protein n=1 Tax=Lewinella cohaerens TaxID=70995 RepID=UPI0003668F07|nr:hypothetical protein [Lewinella cohaerens]